MTSRTVILGTTLALLGCQSPAVGSPPVAAAFVIHPILPEASSRLDAAVDGAEPTSHSAFVAILQRASRLRQLPVLHPIDLRLVDRSELAAIMTTSQRDDSSSLHTASFNEISIALGQLPIGYDPAAARETWVRSENAGGFFDASAHRMYVIADTDPDHQLHLLLHEAVHGLQDQHFHFGAATQWRADGWDANTALWTLAEGDAMTATFDADQANDDDASYTEELLRSMFQERPDSGVPRSAQALGNLRIVEGILLVNYFRQKGGWAAVDRLWHTLPATSEQVLHPEKYEEHEPAQPIGPLSPPTHGWTLAYSDVLGEATLRIGLEEWLTHERAVIAASGWGGDRVSLFRLADQSAVGWRIRFDQGSARRPNEQAEEARDALVESLARVSPLAKPTRRMVAGVPTWCVERPALGPLAGAVQGRDLAITAGPYRRTPGGLAASSDCAAACSWAARLVSSK